MSAFDDDRDNGWTGGDDVVGMSDGPVPAFDLAALVDALPRLGSVLWLEHRGGGYRAPIPNSTRRGVVLIDHPVLAPLAHCATASVGQAVTRGGPREWIDFRNVADESIAKLFLLPDTDYLAWDEMTARCAFLPATAPLPRWSAHAAFLRRALARLGAAWRAHVLAFDARNKPWLRTLDARTPLRLSLLGIDLARAIARDEGAEFILFPNS